MDIGKLDKHINVQKPVDLPDGQGGRTREWVTAFLLWGSIKVPRNAAAEVQGAVSSVLTHEIVLRRNSQIVPGWHVLCDNKVYEVMHAYDGYDNATVLQVREIIKRD